MLASFWNLWLQGEIEGAPIATFTFQFYKQLVLNIYFVQEKIYTNKIKINVWIDKIFELPSLWFLIYLITNKKNSLISDEYILPIACTKGGTNLASFSCDSGLDWYSMKVCSMLLKVVGVRVGVVLVGTPELSPSSVRNWNKFEITHSFHAVSTWTLNRNIGKLN